MILAGRTDAGSPLFGNLLELDTIAAVIIGGASFLGGRGHIGHALVGAMMIGVIRNALNLLNVDIFFQLIAIGVVIVLAVEADVLRSHLEGRVRTLRAAPCAELNAGILETVDRFRGRRGLRDDLTLVTVKRLVE